MPQRRDVVAAGAVVFRPGRRVLLVHRPRYDDWSFPKGKLDPGELAAVAGVREVAEETGLHVRLGPQLGDQRYPVAGGRHKTVHYWVGWPVGDDDVSGYLVNDEIDDVRWFEYDDARATLTYEHDRATLAEARAAAEEDPGGGGAPAREGSLPQGLDPQARPGAAADLAGPRPGAAADRPARGVRRVRVVSSVSARCVQTVQPFVETTGWDLDTRKALSEEGATDAKVAALVGDLLGGPDGAVVCTHRPVLPAVWDALGVPDPKLEPAGLLVAHHRKGKVVATEVHQRP